MARPYSLDLRERAVARVSAGESVRAVAARLRVSVSSVVKWSQRFRAPPPGRYTAIAHGCCCRSATGCLRA